MEITVKKRTFEMKVGNIIYDVETSISDEHEAVSGIEDFAKKYTITSCKHVTPGPVREATPPQMRTSAKLASVPSALQREYSILNKMPEEFSSKDFVEYWMEQGNYDEPQLKKSFSYPIDLLKKQGFIEVVNPEEPSIKRRYKVVAEKTTIDDFLKSIREGQKVIMGTIQ